MIPLGILSQGVVAAGAFDLLETQILTSSAASVTFTGLGSYSDYKHLQIRWTARTARTAFSVDGLNLRFNSDTGNNYAFHQLYGDGSAVTSFAAPTSSNPLSIAVGQISTDLAATGAFGAGAIDILDFSNTSKNTTVRALSGYFSDSTRKQIALRSGVWLNTAALTSLTLIGESANLVAGSRFSLYGIKGE